MTADVGVGALIGALRGAADVLCVYQLAERPARLAARATALDLQMVAWLDGQCESYGIDRKWARERYVALRASFDESDAADEVMSAMANG